MYELIVTRCYRIGHGLRNFKGADEPIHFHDWRIEVRIAAEKLDASGCAIDFHEIDALLDKILQPFVGKAFNDIPPFDRESPSAEKVAEYLYRSLADKINAPGRRLTSVTAGEDPEHCAAYISSAT